jgi:hypothetical protein
MGFPTLFFRGACWIKFKRQVITLIPISSILLSILLSRHLALMLTISKPNAVHTVSFSFLIHNSTPKSHHISSRSTILHTPMKFINKHGEHRVRTILWAYQTDGSPLLAPSPMKYILEIQQHLIWLGFDIANPQSNYLNRQHSEVTCYLIP